MRTIHQIVKYESGNLLKNKWLLSYMGFYLLICSGFFWISGDTYKVLTSLINVLLIFIPLITLIYASIFFYDASDFIKLILTQPIKRKHCFYGIFLSVCLPFCLALFLGTFIPFIVFSSDLSAFPLLGLQVSLGMLLTFIFTGIALWISLKFDEKASGVGVAIIVWLIFAFFYDGLILLVSYLMSNYPIEKLVIALIFLNPVDLVRTLLIMQFDISALMGYTGAMFSYYFEGFYGITTIAMILLFWSYLPFYRSKKLFLKKDF